MASTRELTGGSGDLNPQLLRFPALKVDTGGGYYSAVYNLPVVLTPQQSASTQRIQLLELLRLEAFCPMTPDNIASMPPPGGAQESFGGSLVQVAVGSHNELLDYGDDDLLLLDERRTAALANANGTPSNFGYAFNYDMLSHRWVKDFTDGAGHGILIAAPTITFLGFQTGAAQETWSLELLFRLKNVPQSELLGLVLTQFGT